ncbi:MAG: hypothetical protein DWH78_12325 [Planctomycetota bacterium]|nr:MAG: hypothetical protein DWH78_12325 [Planctomycetota bacterium]
MSDTRTQTPGATSALATDRHANLQAESEAYSRDPKRPDPSRDRTVLCELYSRPVCGLINCEIAVHFSDRADFVSHSHCAVCEHWGRCWCWKC